LIKDCTPGFEHLSARAIRVPLPNVCQSGILRSFDFSVHHLRRDPQTPTFASSRSALPVNP